MNLPSKDSAAWRGLVTAGQAIVGFTTGLVIAVWAVPGVPQTVFSYVTNNLPQVLLTIGIPVAISTGLVSYVINLIRKDVKNY